MENWCIYLICNYDSTAIKFCKSTYQIVEQHSCMKLQAAKGEL